MSASSKKKLRKEQNAEIMTERQKKERSEARKLKAMTVSFLAVLIAIVCIFVGTISVDLVVKNGVIEEALVETLGCSGMTHSAAMASEILPGKTILEALNTDLVCDAINTAMRELFLQIVYGRTQSAFSEGGLVIGASLEDLGKGLRTQTGTMFGTKAKGTRYLEMAEGYCTRMALDADDQVIGYEFVHLGKVMEMVKNGVDANEAIEKAKGTYGRFKDAVKYIDPRKE